MYTNIEIKMQSASEDDLPAILNLYAQAEMDNNHVLPIEKAKILFRKISSYPQYHIFVAISEEKLIGTFALLIMDNLAHMGALSGIIEDLAVDVAFQNKGVGKFMMNYAMDFCKKSGCYKLALSSNIKRERAHKFYESLGFKQHGISFSVI